MAYTKQTIFTLPLATAHQIRDDAALTAIMQAKEDDLATSGYDKNVAWQITTDQNGAQICTTIRKWPDATTAQEWVTYGSAQTAAKGYSWTLFEVQDI